MFAYVVSADLRISRRGLEKSCQHVDRCCLAGAVWSEESEDFSLLDFEADVVNCLDLTVVECFREFVDYDYRLGEARNDDVFLA